MRQVGHVKFPNHQAQQVPLCGEQEPRKGPNFGSQKRRQWQTQIAAQGQGSRTVPWGGQFPWGAGQGNSWAPLGPGVQTAPLGLLMGGPV